MHDSVKFGATDAYYLTDLSSSSLAGLGHVPGSRVTALKKLYEHNPSVNAKKKWANEWCCAVCVISRVSQQKKTQIIELKMMPAKYGVWFTLSV